MKTWYSPYRLVAKSGLNSKTHSLDVEGYLLKVEFEKERVGYGAFQGWPSLGDLSSSELLGSLQRDRPHNLVKRAIDCARVDAEMRERGESSDGEIRNHFLITDLEKVEVLQIESQGFQSVKLKVGYDLQSEAQKTKELFQSSSLKLRFDFNARGNEESVLHFFSELGEKFRDRVEMVEDPTPYNAKVWQRLNNELPVALDFEFEKWQKEPIDLAVLVLKPERQDITSLQRLNHFKNFTITSAMGHPLGQSWAAYQALHSSLPLLECGLNSHTAYEPNEFSRELSSDAKFRFTSGRGLGFDEQLEKQEWRALHD